MKVAVILGGASFERDVSLKTGKAVIEACKKSNYDVQAVVIGHIVALSCLRLTHFKYWRCSIALRR